MKSLLLFICFIPLINSFSQEIYFTRDTMRIDNNYARDSIMIYNRGTVVLKIDSIKCRNTNYGLNFVSNDHPNEWKLLNEYINSKNVVEIQPNDSIKVRLSVAFILVKQAQAQYDQIDTMYFYNNSTNSQIQSLLITNKLIMGDVDADNIPVEYSLSQNYPNPFNPNTKILFSLNRDSKIVLDVYDNIGRNVKELFRGYKNIGNYEVIFDGRGLPSGVYYYKLTVGLNSIIKKMLLLK